MGSKPDASEVGFWRKGDDECDAVVVRPGGVSEYVEVKRSGARASRCIDRAAIALRHKGVGYVLTSRYDRAVQRLQNGYAEHVVEMSAAAWLFAQRDAAGGTIRFRTT